jgi:hypothetical protein
MEVPSHYLPEGSEESHEAGFEPDITNTNHKYYCFFHFARSRVLWNQRVHCCVYKNPPQVPFLNNIVQFWVVLARFCPILVQVKSLQTPFGLVTRFIPITITHNYCLRRYACTQLTILRQCSLLDVFTL